jgi:predicted metalloprotease
MRPRSARVLAAAVALLVIGAGCSDDSSKSATASDNSDDPGVENPFSDDATDVKAATDNKLPEGDDAIMKLAAKEVEDFWKVEFPKTFGGKAYEPISGGLIPYGPDTNPEPGCGGPATYDEIKQNAFYCPEGDFVAWDTVALTDPLLDKFGSFTLGLVMAHELGHGVQARAGIFDNPKLTTFDTEQQADCFAGAWAKTAKTDDKDSFDVSDKELDQALSGFLVLSDAVGTPTQDPNAHGSGFQRVEAFQDGYQDGTKQCKTYDKGSPNQDEGQFDAADPTGDVSVGELLDILPKDLDKYWKVVGPEVGADWTDAKVQKAADFKTCEGKKLDISDGALPRYCKKEDIVLVDDKVLLPQADETFGDGAAGLFIIEAYTTRVQVLAGELDKAQTGGLQNDCLTGAYLASLVKPDTVDVGDASDNEKRPALSAGDLDEVLKGFLFIGANTEQEASSDPGPSAFRRVDALRQGFRGALNDGSVASSKSCLSTFDAQGGDKAGSDVTDPAPAGDSTNAS